MAKILMPIPSLDFDPTEVAVSWSVLTRLGHTVIFATPDGRPGEADGLMVSGQGLDPWGCLPVLKRFVVVGRALRANRDGRRAYAEMRGDPRFQAPMSWAQARRQHFDGLVLCGGHRARGMRAYLETPILQETIAEAFATDRPVGAICHGVLLVARSRDASGRSVLFGRRTTALTWDFEFKALRVGRLVRFWDPGYYRTYPDGSGRPRGYMSVQQEVTRALASDDDFEDVPVDLPGRRIKTGGVRRDSWEDSSPAFVVRDRNYVSARWPGDTHTFARAFAGLFEG